MPDSPEGKFLRIGGDLAVEFANTDLPRRIPAGRSIRGVTSSTSSSCVEAWRPATAPCSGRWGRRTPVAAPGPSRRPWRSAETIRAMLGAVASRRPLRAGWIAEVNEALAAGLGAPRLIRQDGGWRLGLSPGLAAPPRPWPRSRAPWPTWSCRAAGSRSASAPTHGACSLRDRSQTAAAVGARWPSAAIGMKVAAHVRRHGRRRSA